MFDKNIPTVLKNYNGAIAEPLKTDVLCGKDTTLARHPGNQLFREKIQAELPQYLKARSKQDKMKITKSIVQFVTIKQKSRFLKLKNNGQWVEIDGTAARDKVSHALRFAARQQKKIAKEQADENSSLGSSDDSTYENDSTAAVPPPPPMPSRQEMERNTTNVEELFAAFDQTLTGPAVDDCLEFDRPVRRNSSRLWLNLLSSFDMEEETHQAHTFDSFSFDHQERQFLSTGITTASHDEVTQWTTC